MKIYLLEEIFWDDVDGYNHKTLDAYYDQVHAIIEGNLMTEQYAFDYETHKRSYRVTAVNLK